MSKTIEVQVYKWDELSQTAKVNARDWYIEGLRYAWWEDVYEMAKEDGIEKGFMIDSIYFSGFYSQGDGASWTGRIDIRKWLDAYAPDTIGVAVVKHLITTGWIEEYINVRTSGRYSHEGSMDFGEVEVHGVLHDSVGGVERGDFDIPNDGSIFAGMDLIDVIELCNTDENNPYRISNLAELDYDMQESARNYAKQIYAQLREEYEYLCGEEMMLDHFEANDYYFDEDGRVV